MRILQLGGELEDTLTTVCLQSLRKIQQEG
jgi:hypothetical protein